MHSIFGHSIYIIISTLSYPTTIHYMRCSLSDNIDPERRCRRLLCQVPGGAPRGGRGRQAGRQADISS